MRLQKFLAECGVASRRGAENLIRQGQVTVNGEPATIGRTVEPDTDSVALNGEPVQRDINKVYIVFNKPEAVITSSWPRT